MLIILFVGLSALGYFSSELYNNIDMYINIYNYLKSIK